MADRAIQETAKSQPPQPLYKNSERHWAHLHRGSEQCQTGFERSSQGVNYSQKAEAMTHA